MKSVHQDLSRIHRPDSRDRVALFFLPRIFSSSFFFCVCVCVRVYIYPLFFRSSTSFPSFSFFLLLSLISPIPRGYHETILSTSLVDRDLSLSFGTVLAFFLFFFFFLTSTRSLHPAISRVHLARGMITRAPRLKCLTVCILGPDCSPR